jgi:outer membrane protein assembly factor BamB
VNKILGLLLIYLLITNCSLDKKSGLWSENSKIDIEKDLIITELFEDEKTFSKEFNSNVKIKLKSSLTNNNFTNNLSNNNGRVNYNGSLENISRYRYSSIDNFDQFEPEIVFDNNNVIFFDNKASILKFDEFSKLIWKVNYYQKAEKKLKPILTFANDQNILIVADNIAKYYALDIKTGKLLWIKNNSAPFNSQIKIYKNKFFLTDLENILRCYSIKDGKELWNVKTDTAFIKSQKKLSIIIFEEKIFFNNSIGDISSVDVNTGKLLWQIPTLGSSIYESAFQLKTSDLIVSNKSILFSNNKNEFFSIDINTGTLNWKQKINSIVRPTAIDDIVFTVSNEGFLAIVESKTGNIVRITNIFDRIKEKKRSKIIPVGFIVGEKNIYLTTNNGRLIIVDISTGKSSSILKIDNEKISRPFILNKNLFIIKDNAIIKIN